MIQNTPQLYEFHFKIDIEMQKELLETDLYKRIRRFSRLITHILKTLLPQIEKEHLACIQRRSKYELVNQNVNIKRKSTHIYIPLALYRLLKLMHQDLDFYSIAQLVRWILRFFLKLIKSNESNAVKKLKRKLRIWNKSRDWRKYKIKSIRQLLHFIYQKPSETYFITIYNMKFIPINIHLF